MRDRYKALKQILQDTENALGASFTVLFAVRQRIFVTYLENEGLLANSALAWEDATSELSEASNIVWSRWLAKCQSHSRTLL
jgi:hypothetical protein